MSTSATSASAVSVRDLRKNYGAVEATRGVSFEIFPGEIVGLVGDNGAGKSTLTKMIAGDVPPTSGEIRIGGTSVQSSSTTWARDHGVEMVYQDLALCDNLDICANIFLGREITHRGVLGYARLSHDVMMTKAQQLLTMLEVKLPNLREPVTALSGGQRQMVAIARSVAYEPKLVIMDEPTAALSVSAGQPVLELIRRLPQRNVAILLISHRLSDVLTTADRILVLRRGKIVAAVRASEIDEGDLLHLMAGINVPNED
ncbi:ATP-binding cassette domain-containing protein [Mesorhizobium sp. AD1-1]|uniref:ATP-binding cassette domain-containing protein n=1 Tax=unclassified Mesorhizobium TaxID=325217 RepID=UPI001CCFE4F2|nr:MULTISPECIES: ATP-binding cassette domain-containing protein [unclassified Mesorhizobium]MBZ9719312.1 ATP-binding cassette domain-containing protein [Mesorhizobium sp. AD1-1]MCA0030499.1 ATP-binding cassette domain-containing protein [Mesorhizobium sp. B263B2A]